MIRAHPCLILLALTFTAATSSAGGNEAVVARINAEDKAQSPDAAVEYKRRLALLPQIEKARENGDPKSPDAFSLKDLQKLDDDIKTELSWIEADLRKLPKLALKEIKDKIPRGPGPPGSDLAARREYWRRRHDEYRRWADLLARLADPESKTMKTDEFGDVVPESLTRRRDLEQEALDQARREAAALEEKIDAAAAAMNRNYRLGLPRLSGLALSKLPQVLSKFCAELSAVKVPQDGTEAAREAQAALPGVVADAGALRRAALAWARADALAPVFDADATALARVRAVFVDLARLADDALADAQVDQTFSDGTSGELYEPARQRKLAFLEKLPPRLKDAKAALENGLIPYQRRRIAEASKDGALARHYQAKLALLVSLQGG